MTFTSYAVNVTTCKSCSNNNYKYCHCTKIVSIVADFSSDIHYLIFTVQGFSSSDIKAADKKPVILSDHWQVKWFWAWCCMVENSFGGVKVIVAYDSAKTASFVRKSWTLIYSIVLGTLLIFVWSIAWITYWIQIINTIVLWQKINGLGW